MRRKACAFSPTSLMQLSPFNMFLLWLIIVPVAVGLAAAAALAGFLAGIVSLEVESDFK